MVNEDPNQIFPCMNRDIYEFDMLKLGCVRYLSIVCVLPAIDSLQSAASIEKQQDGAA